MCVYAYTYIEAVVVCVTKFSTQLYVFFLAVVYFAGYLAPFSTAFLDSGNGEGNAGNFLPWLLFVF